MKRRKKGRGRSAFQASVLTGSALYTAAKYFALAKLQGVIHEIRDCLAEGRFRHRYFDGNLLRGFEVREMVTLACGCFWCSEAIFKRLRGVESVVPGYAGGSVANPTYEQVSTEQTGHAEAVQIVFDPTVVSYETLLDVFFRLHDPTTKDRQGPDVGPQYRSVIFYHNEKQRKIAEKVKEKIEALGMYKDPIVTEIVPFQNFYPAEDYHVNYYETHKNAPYCRLVIDPKITKLYKEYGEKVKEEYKA